LAVFAGIAGCANVEGTEEGVASSTQAIVGVDEFLYLRCNTTGWGADSANLLAATGEAGVYAIEYDVTSNEMVTTGDQCVLTRTNSATGWGSVSSSFGATQTGVVTAPGQWSINETNSSPVTIQYPALGRYRASVNWTTGTVSVSLVSTTAAAEYYYLRCNATSWDIGSANRFATATNGLALSYSVNQSWMVSDGDQCVVTRTNQLDGWGTAQATLGTTTASTLVVPAASGVTTSLISAGQQFTVRYPAVGQYQASFNPTTGQLRIAVPGSDVPETGLHGAVESLGNNRVRVTYDFQSAEQLQDFVSTNAAATAVSLTDGRLVVQNVATTDTINAARLIKGFKVDSMQYQAELVSGAHLNVYVGTLWDGTWNPARGYGAIHRADGRVFVANGRETSAASPAVVPGTLYNGRIDATEQGLTWTVDGNAQTLAFPYYGGASRTVVLGGYASTVAFDNLVLEGTVDGLESDGTETNPDVNHGNVVALGDGRVRITYDFSDPQQKYDFVVNSATGTRRELNDGRLLISHVSDANALKVALYKYNVRIDRLSYRAELLAGNHVNVYLNTIWDENWAPSVGCGGIHRFDGRIMAINGTVTATTDTTPVAARTSYLGDVVLSSTGLNWTVNDGSVALDSPCHAGTDGTLGLGSFASDVAFDDVVIEGQLE
jgi:acylphosphatase